MTDPVSAEVASQAVQQQGVEEVGGVDESEPSKDFSDSLGAQADDASVDSTQGSESDFAIDEVDDVPQIEEVSEIPTDDFIQGLLREEEDIQAMMEDCLDGAEMDQQEMLQMQAVIYSYSQRVELTTKVVEGVSGSIEQVMNTQV